VPEDTATLEREVRYLHGAFFERDAPPEIVDRYIRANRVCVPEDQGSQRRIVCMISRRLDVEAVELALRWRRVDMLLTRKIQILFYLVEVRRDYYGYFINQDSGRLRAWTALVSSIPCSLWKFAKGTFLIWRYGLV